MKAPREVESQKCEQLHFHTFSLYNSSVHAIAHLRATTQQTDIKRTVVSS